MNRLKLMTIIGTRPEIIKLSEIIKKCDIYFDHVLVHTGQNYDRQLNDVFFEELGLNAPSFYLNVSGENLGVTIGNIIAKSYVLMLEQRPDAILVLGDTNSCLSVIAAKRLKIPIFHMEAGNRCKDENLPEEVIRRIVDVTSDVNLCYSEHARRYILDSGVKPEYTFVVGSPMAEILGVHYEKIMNSNILQNFGLNNKKYIVLSAHREENIDIESNFLSLMNSVNSLAARYDMPIIYSCHPRSRKKIESVNFRFDERVIVNNPFGFFDYLYLQINAFCVISDSGTLPEESAYFGFPAVSIRTSTERPEAIEKGVFVIGNISSDEIIQAVNVASEVAQLDSKTVSLVPDYAEANISYKVINLIQSYTGIVNKYVWKKND